MSKRKFYFRRFSSPNGFGLTLFRSDRLNPWRPYFVLSYRPHQRRLLLRLPRRLVGLSWWPARFWNAAALLAERDKGQQQHEHQPQQHKRTTERSPSFEKVNVYGAVLCSAKPLELRGKSHLRQVLRPRFRSCSRTGLA